MVADIRQFVDPVDLRQFFDLRQASQLDRSKPCSTAAFDITFAVTTLFAICGLALDYRSHMIYGTDQTLFNTYHLLIYTATVMVGWLLAYTGITNVLAGDRFWRWWPQLVVSRQRRSRISQPLTRPGRSRPSALVKATSWLSSAWLSKRPR